MAINRVQLQKGLSLPSFMEKYGSEEQCKKALMNWRWSKGFICPSCSSQEHWKLSDGTFECINCHKQTTLTSGTIFHSTKLPLTKWFLAIHLMSQSKNGISQLELARQVGVSKNTGALLYHKIAQVMHEREQEKLLSGDIELDDAYFGGKKSGKRGRGSSNKTPFVAAVEKKEGKPNQIKLSVVARFSKREIACWAKRHLKSKSKVLSDGLNCFPSVKDAGCSHESVIVGNSRNTKLTARFNSINCILGNLKTALAGTFHKLDPNHLQRHLSTFSYRFNRRYQLKEMIPRFTYIAARTTPFPRRLLTSPNYNG